MKILSLECEHEKFYNITMRGLTFIFSLEFTTEELERMSLDSNCNNYTAQIHFWDKWDTRKPSLELYTETGLYAGRLDRDECEFIRQKLSDSEIFKKTMRIENMSNLVEKQTTLDDVSAIESCFLITCDRDAIYLFTETQDYIIKYIIPVNTSDKRINELLNSAKSYGYWNCAMTSLTELQLNQFKDWLTDILAKFEDRDLSLRHCADIEYEYIIGLINNNIERFQVKRTFGKSTFDNAVALFGHKKTKEILKQTNISTLSYINTLEEAYGRSKQNLINKCEQVLQDYSWYSLSYNLGNDFPTCDKFSQTAEGIEIWINLEN